MTGSPDSANDGTSQRGSLFRQHLDPIVKGFLLAHGERVSPLPELVRVLNLPQRAGPV